MSCSWRKLTKSGMMMSVLGSMRLIKKKRPIAWEPRARILEML